MRKFVCGFGIPHVRPCRNLHSLAVGDSSTELNTERSYNRIYSATPLEMAVSSRCLPLVKTLIAKGVDVNRVDNRYGGGTVMMAAVLVNSPAIIRALLAAGADVNIRDEIGWSPLGIAEEFDAKHLIRILKRSKARH